MHKFQFSGLEGLLNHHIDILVTPDFVKKENINYATIAEYQLVLLVSAMHSLANIKQLTPEQLCKKTLLTFPVSQERLDILTHFLTPSHLAPAKQQKIESLEIMLQMTALGRGVCVLPEWLTDNKIKDLKLKKIYIGKHGLHRKLFLAIRQSDEKITYIKQFLATRQRTTKQSSLISHVSQSQGF